MVYFIVIIGQLNYTVIVLKLSHLCTTKQVRREGGSVEAQLLPARQAASSLMRLVKCFSPISEAIPKIPKL